MSSPSLSDSPGTFKVDCNVAGAFLETRPKFNFLQNSSDFFFFLSSFFYHHGNLGSTIIFATPDILITSGCGYSPMMMSPCGRVKFKMAAIVSRKYGLCCRERIVHIWTFVAVTTDIGTLGAI